MPGTGPVTTEVTAFMAATVTIITGGFVPEAGIVVVPGIGPVVNKVEG